MPSARQLAHHVSTSPTSSGSSAEVASSNSISPAASPARARSRRAAADRRTTCRDRRRALCARPTLRSSAGASRRAVRARLAQHLDRADDDVVQRRQMREQVEALEHHADPRAHARVFHIAHRHATAAGARFADRLVVDQDLALVRPFQPVDAALQRGLARSRRADHRQFLPRTHDQIDAAQHLQRAESLVQANDLHQSGRRPASSGIVQANSAERSLAACAEGTPRHAPPEPV